MRAVVLLALMGCGGGQTVVHYAPPMPRPATNMPVVHELELAPVPKPDALLDVDRLDAPAGTLATPAAKSSSDVVRAARAENLIAAAERGGKCGMDGDVLVCKWATGKTYEVYTCAGEQTVIELAPGETATTDFHFGPNRLLGRPGGHEQQADNRAAVSFWNLSEPERSGDGRGNMVVQYYVLPANDRTIQESYLQFGTAIGRYRLKLVVRPTGDQACATAIRWTHPDLEIQRLIAEQKRKERFQVAGGDDSDEEDSSLRNITCASGAYRIWVAEGSPRWVPTQVSHVCVGDHPRVTIQFPRSVAWTKAPTLATDGGVAAYRYVAEDYTMVVDGLFSRGVLSMGNEESGQEVVYIQRLQEPR